MAKQNRSDVVLAAVLRALKARRDQEAVRLLVDGLTPGVAPIGADLTPWLGKTIGREATARLVRVLAFYPCFYCKQGLQTCGDCQGRGKSSFGEVCESCVGLGKSRCDFCDAAGWATYNFVPCGLRLAVILQRVPAAVKELETRLARPLPKASPTKDDRLPKALSQELLAINRLAGIFENAVDAARRLVRSHPETTKVAAKILKTCQLAWRKIEPRMRETLHAMGESLSGRSERAARGEAATASRDRASYYVRLARSNGFSGTCLSHPFLMRLAKKQVGQRSAKVRKKATLRRR